MEFKLSLHQAQLKVFSDPKPLKTVCAGRRLGKSRLLFTTAIYKCLSYDGEYDPASPPSCVILSPTLKQGKQIHWKSLLNLLENSPFVERILKNDFRIIFKGNKPDLLLRGANDDEGNSLRGLKLYWIGSDEHQDLKPDVWTYVIEPALADTPNSSALVIGTPKGRAHPFYNFCEAAKSNPKASYYHFTTADNPFFDKSKLEHYRSVLPPKAFRQEFEASFESFEGQWLDQLQDKHLITLGNYSSSDYEAIWCSVDWGDKNPAVSVIGLKNSTFYIIDSWDNPDTNKTVTQDEFLRRIAFLCSKYHCTRVYVPDDRPAACASLRQWGHKHNIRAMQKSIIVTRQRPGITERADLINSLFHQDRLYINKKLSNLIESFKSYCRAKDSNGYFVNKPANGLYNHLYDSSAYCLGYICYKHKMLLVS